MLRVTSFGKVANAWRDQYLKQMKSLTAFEWIEIPIKKIPNERPPHLLLEEKKFLQSSSRFFLLDDSGVEMNSKQFSDWCFKESRHLVIGPAVGFHPDFKKKAAGMISLSKLTFTHSLAQTMLAEALYRSLCIRMNHPFVK
jgi:23S rRNA (pseudouridine1915-N3)-methyltransferase